MLQDKNIIIGVTGGIAAYKTVELVSRLRKSGANVHVIMTQGAQNFVTELTFREISGHPVVTSMWDRVQEFKVEHIALAQLADMVVIAPATANILAKMAIGMAVGLFKGIDKNQSTISKENAYLFYAKKRNLIL